MSSMFGVVRKQLKSHPAVSDRAARFRPRGALIPLFIFIGGGATMSMLYLSRLALRNPDVSWDRKNNPEPWNKMEPTQQYKFTLRFRLVLQRMALESCVEANSHLKESQKKKERVFSRGFT
ncbi:hypothetical protein fugu_000903 [Takifugu bimaculatus]|uniref:Cytochrome c oxidase subunit NDUFA4 n=1 Tax=Takifugu bimaculatus TaxID=433685 RepID=A0A4Z2CIF0_9TELE|nr:hypothetical protein fugu_000903 [Takifugu bimaculatus]